MKNDNLVQYFKQIYPACLLGGRRASSYSQYDILEERRRKPYSQNVAEWRKTDRVVRGAKYPTCEHGEKYQKSNSKHTI